MNTFTVSQSNYTSHTLVPNRFIDEYLVEANDAQIKIYLYLLRTMSAHKATGISDIADVFNYTEQDVRRALRYWEKKHLLFLQHDENKNICGIRIEHLSELSADPRQADGNVGLPLAAPRRTDENGGQSLADPRQTIPDDRQNTGAEIIALHKGTAPEVPASEPVFEKPVYSLDRLSAFQKREDTKQLMFAIQTYIGRPLSQSNVASILFLSDTLHFSNDLIDYLIQYCVERDKKDFRYIERVGITWAENQITSPKEAARYCARYDRTVYGVMRALGKNSNPTERELAYIRKWTKDYAFSLDLITEACNRTVLATDKHRFEYTDGILTSWRKQNVQSKADVSALDQSHRACSAAAANGAPARSSSSNNFNQFRQNTYDFDELEKEIVSN
ncbi:MAG: DnaD domain protein [Clostridium sp.]|nr:DnaD domain protein [Clostridium sp.]